MKSKKALLKKSQLYLILNRDSSSLKDLDFFQGQPGIVQLRDKLADAKQIFNLALKLSKFYRKTNTLFIVNNDPILALLSLADGVHLGQEDLALKAARCILGKDKLIGISCSNLKQALKAQNDGADYLGIGPIYKSPLKPRSKAIGLKVLRQLKKRIKIPYFAIGNINENNLTEILATQARRIAVSRAVLKTTHPKLTLKLLMERLK